MMIRKYSYLALSVFIALPVSADQVYLYTMFHDDNSNGERFRTKVEDMQQCLEVIKAAKMTMPTRPSGDYEVMGAMWCGGDMQRNYNARWWKDEVKTARVD